LIIWTHKLAVVVEDASTVTGASDV
jgi:hypothetical protein